MYFKNIISSKLKIGGLPNTKQELATSEATKNTLPGAKSRANVSFCFRKQHKDIKKSQSQKQYDDTAMKGVKFIDGINVFVTISTITQMTLLRDIDLAPDDFYFF